MAKQSLKMPLNLVERYPWLTVEAAQCERKRRDQMMGYIDLEFDCTGLHNTFTVTTTSHDASSCCIGLYL